jgi:hypothetical protein
MSDEIPIKYQPLFSRISDKNNNSKADAIKGFCLRCVGYQYKRVKHCSTINCPLHKVRPFQVKIKNEN